MELLLFIANLLNFPGWEKSDSYHQYLAEFGEYWILVNF